MLLPLLLLLGAFLVEAAEFNSSVTVTVNAWSPMIWLGESYQIDKDGTARRRAGDDLFFNWYFVGTEYNASGTLKPGLNSGPYLAKNTQLGTDPVYEIFLGETENNATGLGRISDLALGAYTISFAPQDDADVTFESLSYSVPVLTQAWVLCAGERADLSSPTFEAMKSDHHRAIGQDSKLNEGFSIHPRRSRKYLENASSNPPEYWDPLVNTSYSIGNNGVVLDKSTEISYVIPDNSTLVNVTAAVGLGRTCYVTLEPMPDWWNLRSVPMVNQNKPNGLPNEEQTMFVLPLDPTVRYNLTVGPMANDTKCHVGGVTSYSFF